MRKANHEDIDEANNIARRRDIVKIEIPIVSGFMAVNIEKVVDVTKIVRIVNSIYNYEGCTRSTVFKGLCALYTNLYLRSSSIDA
jgi:hypothetical protein